jgi:protein-tyrosine kinase
MAKHEKSSRLGIPAEEAYKILRTNIRFCGAVNNIRTISVTSCIQGEGKTTTSVNLAVSMADSGMKTLLVDTDFRRPMIEKMLGIDAKIGLTSYITGAATMEEIIYSTNIENLYITPCGIIPPNPSELLSTASFSMFVKHMKNQFLKEAKGQLDIVIFDTPPLGSVIDSAIVSALADGTILVIKPKTINYKLACQVKEQLEKANASLLGVVINGIKKKDLRYGYNNYYKYYTTDDKKLENPLKKFLKRVKLYS